MTLPNQCKRCHKYYFNVKWPCTCKEREADLKQLERDMDMLMRIETKKEQMK